MANQFEEVKTSSFWKAVLAEIVGTFILVVCGCAACLGSDWDKVDSPRLVEISLAFGLGVATAVWCIGHVSGGHINPAVSCGMVVARRITVVRCVMYILAQCVGAIFGAGVLYGLTPANSTGNLGMTELGNEVTDVQGFGVELIITFVLVLTVFASCDGKRKDLKGSIPLSIGLSVTLCHFFAVKFTGASMNPARSFGVAVVMNLWNDHWIYWVGPILGGVVAASLYEIFFAKDGSLKNFCCCTIERQPSTAKETVPEKNASELAAV